MMFGVNLTLKEFPKKSGKYLISLPNEDDKSLSVSRKFSKNFKENFPKHKPKYNVSINSWNELNTKILSILWLITNKNCGIIQNLVSIIKKQFEYQYLNSMTPFLWSLVIYFVGYRFKRMIISWYKYMTPFLDNIRLVTKKYLWQWHDSFHGIDYNSNK